MKLRPRVGRSLTASSLTEDWTDDRVSLTMGASEVTVSDVSWAPTFNWIGKSMVAPTATETRTA